MSKAILTDKLTIITTLYYWKQNFYLIEHCNRTGIEHSKDALYSYKSHNIHGHSNIAVQKVRVEFTHLRGQTHKLTSTMEKSKIKFCYHPITCL